MKENNYDDIINLDHYEPKYHKRMSMKARAAQFAPFAALNGYGEEIHETERYTDIEIEISNEVKEKLDLNLKEIVDKIKENPKVELIYFIADKTKNGGEYKTLISNVKKIDKYAQRIILANGIEISVKDIIKLEVIK